MKGTTLSQIVVKSSEVAIIISFLDEAFMKAMFIAGADVKQARETPTAFDAYKNEIAWSLTLTCL